MREAGKVSLAEIDYTRLQSIKDKHLRMDDEISRNELEVQFGSVHGDRAFLFSVIDCFQAALEETQHQLQDLKYQIAEQVAFRAETDKELRESQTENVKLVNELAEAQQQRDYWANKEEEARWETAEYAEDLREAQQTIARLTAALIAERDAALTWDGTGTVRRINEALGEGAKKS